MSNAHITIAGKKLPVLFKFGTVYRIAKHFKAEPTQLLQKMQSTEPTDIIELGAVIAWHGMKEAGKDAGKKVPYDSPDAIIDELESVADLAESTKAFTDAFLKTLGLSEQEPAEGNAEAPEVES